VFQDPAWKNAGKTMNRGFFKRVSGLWKGVEFKLKDIRELSVLDLADWFVVECGIVGIFVGIKCILRI
jgi:hypothetical protein